MESKYSQALSKREPILKENKQNPSNTRRDEKRREEMILWNRTYQTNSLFPQFRIGRIK